MKKEPYIGLCYLQGRNVGSFHSPKKAKLGKISLKKRVILLFLALFNAFLLKNDFNEIEKIAKLCQHSSKRHFSCFFHRSNLKKNSIDHKIHEKTQKKVKNAYNLVFFIIFMKKALRGEKNNSITLFFGLILLTFPFLGE